MHHKRSNKTGGHVPRNAEYAFANAIIGCLSIGRKLSLDAVIFPAMERDRRLQFVEGLTDVFERMEEAVFAATGRHYHLPAIEPPLPGKGVGETPARPGR